MEQKEIILNSKFNTHPFKVEISGVGFALGGFFIFLGLAAIADAITSLAPFTSN